MRKYARALDRLVPELVVRYVISAPIRTRRSYLIPQQGTLPILQPFLDIGNATGTTALVKPFVDLLNPVFKVIVDLAYDRNANPGIPQTFQLFPIVNPITLTVNLLVAV